MPKLSHFSESMLERVAQSRKLTLSLKMMFVFLTFVSCEEKSSEANFAVDFSFEFQTPNRVAFSNGSTGEYYSLIWDFGNGETRETTNKREEYTIYYPVAGDYEVSLTAVDFQGVRKEASKTVTIASTDLQAAFEVAPIGSSANDWRLTDTSLGAFDSVVWVYRGRRVGNTNQHDAYFPFSGSYTIVMELHKDETMHSQSKTISVTQDDPGYLDRFELAWSDEFDQAELDGDTWTYETGATGWGNNELQNYTNGGNLSIAEGIMTITAEKVNDNTAAGSYTSTRIVSRAKREFQYGKFEIRANLPQGRGTWPAIWMLGSNIGSVDWPACGEIDIMEYVGYQPNVIHSTVHTPSGFGGNGSGSSMQLTTCEEEFHVYGIIWNERYISFYVDDSENEVFRYAPALKTPETWPFDQPFFFIMNIAIGGSWGGVEGVDNSIFPQTMEIDYVRVYQE